MDRRKRTLALLLGAVALAAGALATVLVLVSRSSGSSEATPPRQSPALFAGVPQHGASLGDPKAPALYEFADLQCPYCAEFARHVLPTVVDRYVRTGKVRLVFRGLAFIGGDSVKALRAVEAAGAQDRLWNVLDTLYAAQGVENSGWVTDGLLQQVGAATPGLDAARWSADAGSQPVTARMQAAAAHAASLGVDATPTFVLGTQPLRLAELTPTAFAAALDPLLAQ